MASYGLFIIAAIAASMFSGFAAAEDDSRCAAICPRSDGCVNAEHAPFIRVDCRPAAESLCYKEFGQCEIQENGECGWTPVDAFSECLASLPDNHDTDIVP